MTSRFLKIPAQQANLNSGLLDFKIPDSGYLNMQNAYISTMINVTTTEGAGVPAGIHNIIPTPKGPSTVPYSNACYIQDFTFSSDKFGALESLKDANVLSQNLDIYRKDFEDLMSANYKSLNQFGRPSYDSIVKWTSPLEFLNIAGASSYLPFEMMIPLKDFMKGIGNLNVYPCAQMGRSNLNVKWNANYITFPENTQQYGAGNARATCVTPQVLGANILVITAPPTFNANNLTSCGLWVGQAVAITAASGLAGVAAGPIYRTIRTIALGGANAPPNQIALTFNANINADPAVAIVAARFQTLAAASVTATFSNPQLIVEQLFPSKKVVRDLMAQKQLVYYPFEVEADQIGAVSSFNRLYTAIDGTCRNVLMLKVGIATDNLISENDTVSGYRLKLNNNDLTKSDVSTIANQCPLYLDQLEKVIENMQMVPVKSLNRLYGALVPLAMGAVIPEDGTDKKLQLAIKATANMTASNLFLFKEVQKVINF